MSKRHGVIAAAAMAMIAISAHAQSPSCPSPFYLDTNPRIGLSELGKLTEAEFYQTPTSHGYGWVVQFFDDEDHPHRAGMTGIGIVRATAGDLGEPGVGGLLWSKVLLDVDLEQSHVLDRDNGGVNLVFVAKEPMGKCGRPSFRLRLEQSGVAFADGRKIGSLSDPPK